MDAPLPSCAGALISRRDAKLEPSSPVPPTVILSLEAPGLFREIPTSSTPPVAPATSCLLPPPRCPRAVTLGKQLADGAGSFKALTSFHSSFERLGPGSTSMHANGQPPAPLVNL